MHRPCSGTQRVFSAFTSQANIMGWGNLLSDGSSFKAVYHSLSVWSWAGIWTPLKCRLLLFFMVNVIHRAGVETKGDVRGQDFQLRSGRIVGAHYRWAVLEGICGRGGFPVALIWTASRSTRFSSATLPVKDLLFLLCSLVCPMRVGCAVIWGKIQKPP